MTFSASVCACLPATTEMVACDASGCKIEWFHYQCVGLTADTIPEGSWSCDVCKGNGTCFPQFCALLIRRLFF